MDQPAASDIVLVVAPIGRDAELVCNILGNAGINSDNCRDIEQLCSALLTGIGAAIIAEEAINEHARRTLTKCLAEQPPWSDLPIIFLTRRDARENPDTTLYSSLHPFGNATLLERPVRVATLVSIVRAALRSRQRQYEVRANLDQLRRAEQEIRLINSQLQTAWEEAMQASRVKSRFLANMSHELRTPLTAVIGYSEMIREQAEEQNNSHLVADSTKIVNASKHLLELITDLLDLSKIEAGRMTLSHQAFSVSDLLKTVAEFVKPLAGKNGNELVVVSAPEEWQMVADQARIRQCLLNLLSNACKFTTGGTVTLAAEKDKKTYSFLVKDTGIGISDDDKGKLFGEFVQLEQTVTARTPGTGLGLALTRRLCELMGGSISVTSKPGLGSTFVMRLPVSNGIKSETSTDSVHAYR